MPHNERVVGVSTSARWFPPFPRQQQNASPANFLWPRNRDGTGGAASLIKLYKISGGGQSFSVDIPEPERVRVCNIGNLLCQNYEGLAKQNASIRAATPLRVKDRKVVAHVSAHFGGPFVVGAYDDRHRQQYDGDGRPMQPLHLGVCALWYKDSEKDGPLGFEFFDYPTVNNYPGKACVHLQWHPTVLQWLWWAEVPDFAFSHQKVPPPNIPPRHPTEPPPTRPVNGPYHTPVANVPVLARTLQSGFAAILARPNLPDAGEKDWYRDSSPDET